LILVKHEETGHLRAFSTKHLLYDSLFDQFIDESNASARSQIFDKGAEMAIQWAETVGWQEKDWKRQLWSIYGIMGTF
jgi:hypothetical protein